MKIATFNINDINKRLANLLGWLKTDKPDVVCLQELKAAEDAFPRRDIERAGYGAVWRGQKAWNGVAILARGGEPVMTRSELPRDASDKQPRYIEAAVNGVLIVSLYAPNGNPQPGPKFDYKLAWMKRLIAHAAELYAAQVPVVLAGDYNVVPTDSDIYSLRSYADNALVQPQPRKLFQQLLDQGWTDAIRARHPDAPMYTFWDYRRNWPRDAGLRLDHLLLSSEAAKRLVDAGVHRDVRDAENASDHVPAWIVLSDAPKRSGPVVSKAQPKLPVKPKLPPAPKRPLLVIDGDSFAHRSYHALPKTIFRSDGSPAGAILGFANILVRLYLVEKPRAVVVGWDTLEKATYRHKAFAAYQSGRQFDDALLAQFKDLRAFVRACGLENARAAGYEADDFLAAAGQAEERRRGTALIASGDRDSFQLASERTTILYPIRGGGMLRIGPAEVCERYGVEPAQVPDFIALRGDPSDKLPGAPGVGATGAADLLRRYGSLEALLKAGRFPNHANQLRLYRSIATMNRKAPLPALANQTPTWSKAAALARRWGLNDLARRLDEAATQPER
ncbi:MAG TPA: exodeoxyribonuclease III [Rhizomicrobium sp.]|jgi:exodeoxyribonuclease-3|nr:exodeoxyribonuclease III [Rhizomicrobium sp.]